MALVTHGSHRRQFLTAGAATAAGLSLRCGRTALAAAAGPIEVHPANPRYFLWRGKSRILIGASEHFGAVINGEFDYTTYLETIARQGFNITRIFTGTLVEPGKGRNTLEPRGEHFLAPWARSKQPGYTKGGNKFDLTQFDPAYFARLRSFTAAASKRGVVVLLTLFTQHFDDGKWSVAPFNPVNNVNGFVAGRHDVYTLDRHGGLLAIQEAMVRKIVGELRGADNVIYEVTYNRTRSLATADWERHMTDVLVAAQKKTGDKKLFALNLSLGRDEGEIVDPRAAVLGHNLADQVLLERYRDERRPIGMMETGFVPSSDREARFRAWEFVLGGAGVFIHVDHAFATKDPLGLRLTKPDAQFGGGPEQRRQLQVLVEIVNGLDFVRMRPAPEILRSPLPPSLSARAFAQPGRSYLVYVRPAPTPREISVRWTGKLVARQAGEHTLVTRSNDGVRLWLDGQLLIDNWADRPLEENTAKVVLQAGKAHDLKIEFFYSGGEPHMRLEWQAAGFAREVVPAAQLRTPEGEKDGLRAEYFVGRDLSRRHLVRKDASVEYGPKLTSLFAPPARQPGPLALALDVSAGDYTVEWLDPASGGRFGHPETVTHAGGTLTLQSQLEEDIALRLLRTDRG